MAREAGPPKSTAKVKWWVGMTRDASGNWVYHNTQGAPTQDFINRVQNSGGPEWWMGMTRDKNGEWVHHVTQGQPPEEFIDRIRSGGGDDEVPDVPSKTEAAQINAAATARLEAQGAAYTTTPSTGPKDEALPTPNVDTQPTTNPSPLGPTTPGSTSGGGGGGAGGSGGASPAATGSVKAQAEGAGGQPVQLPAADEAQLWLIDGTHYAVAWQIPNTSTTLFYHVDNPETLDAIYRGNHSVDREIDTGGSADPFVYLEQNGYGFSGGRVTEIQNTDKHPWDAASKQWAEKSRLVPWMNQPDVLAWLAEGIIEGNPQALTPQVAREQGFAFAEGKSNSELTRDLEIFGMTAGEIDRERSLIRSSVEDTFRRYGVTINDSSQAAIGVAIDNVFRGEWDVNVLQNEVRLFADPVTRDRSTLATTVAEGDTIVSLRQDVTNVRDQVEQWVGPAVSKLLGDRWYESWAEQLRNDPNGQVAFNEALLGLRVANFGAFGDNPGLRYDDMAASMRGLGQRMWGEQLDESDPFFLSLVQKNDLNEAQQVLRKEGLGRGIETVNQEAAKSMMQSFGSGVRNSIEV